MIMKTTGRVLAFVALVFQVARLGATVLVPTDVAELSREAGAIVRGQVVATQSRWTADRRSIETLVTVEAEASLKGSLGSTVQFLVPGGTLGRYQNLVVGAPEFATGQRVVVFLGWTGPSYPYVLGLSQGVFRITPNASGTAWMVRQTLLAEFEQRVRLLAGGQR